MNANGGAAWGASFRVPIETVALDIPLGRMGPAMNALGTDRQRAFVLASFCGQTDPVDWARAAGYVDRGGEHTGIRVTAWRLAHDPAIQAAIQEEARKRLNSLAPAAIEAIAEIVRNPQHKKQLEAAMTVLSRTGISEATVKKVEVTISDQQKMDQIRLRAEYLGIDADALLGKVALPTPAVSGTITEAEYEEVAAPAVRPGFEGLEDLL